MVDGRSGGARPSQRGRGAVSNPDGRFEAQRRVAEDDGWGSAFSGDGAGGGDSPPALATTLTPDRARTIIARNDSPDIPFDRSINPYRGCEHGCIYCFARPTHAHLGLSPGLDFESRLFFKADAPALLDAELRRKSYVCDAAIALGANTDPYQPAERKLEITRGVLEVLRDFNHPVCIVTKSALVQRDIDILAPMAEKRLAAVAISLTTLDRGLARRLEPRAATPERRLETIRALSGAGVPVSVLTSPMIPALNDHELEAILEAAAAAGARSAGYVFLRLPHELKDLFREWLETHAPGRARRVLSLVAQAHGGKVYDSEWGHRLRGAGPYAEALRLRFQLACKRFGLNSGGRMQGLDTSRFKPPPKPGDQLGLF
jgi:DNA repair photolyase